MSDQPPPYPPMNQPPGQWGGVPQPGIVPLRPLDLGDLYGGSIAAVRRNPMALVGIALAASAVVAILTALIRVVFFDGVGTLPQTELANASTARVTEFIVATFVVFVVGILVGVIATAVIPPVVERAVHGQNTTAGEAIALALPKVWRLLGMYLLLILAGVVVLAVLLGIGAALPPLAVILGIILFFVFIYVAVGLTFATSALMIEDLPAVGALKRSFDLVQGAWWRTIGIMLLTAIIVGAIGSLANLIASPTGSTGDVVVSGILTAILSAVTTPFASGVATLLYVDQRIRREGWLTAKS